MIASGPLPPRPVGTVVSHLQPNDGIPSVFMRLDPPREIRVRGVVVAHHFGTGYCVAEIERLP